MSLFTFFRRWRRTDPAWAPTGYRYTYEGHDQTKSVTAAKRADELATKRRELAKHRAGLGESAIITDISERRKAQR